MATKTISLSLHAYEKLRRARRAPDESFSHVVMRATWPEDTISGKELLELLRATPPCFTEEELDAIDRAKAQDQPPESKW